MAERIFQSISEIDNGCGKFLFALATKRNKVDYENRNDTFPLFRCLSKFDYNSIPYTSTVVYLENDRGLPDVYNEVIGEYGNEYDYIVLLHDDLWLNDVMFFEKIISAAKSFDVIGCCGGKSWEPLEDLSKPTIWTYASRNGGASGFMIHAAPKEFNGKIAEYDFDGRSIFATNYGSSPSQVLTIDGSFICLTKKAVLAGVRFDTTFKFHFYDMDVSFNAFVKKMKVGTAPILVTHESLGYSVMQPEYMESQQKFLNKWFAKR